MRMVVLSVRLTQKLESFIEYRLKGRSNKDTREYADKAVKLAEL